MESEAFFRSRPHATRPFDRSAHRDRSIHRGTRGLLLALLLPLAVACGGAAGDGAVSPAPDGVAVVEEAASTITPADIGRRIGILAADSMLGRDTPSPELEEAAEYIASEFRRLGLEPAGEDGGYIDRYVYEPMRLAAEDAIVRVVGQAGEPPRYERDYFLLPSMQGPVTAPGYYAGTAGEVRALPQDARGAVLVFELPAADPEELQAPLVSAIQVAMVNGAAGVVAILDPEFPGTLISQIAPSVLAQALPIPIVGITDEAGRQLIRAAGKEPDAILGGGHAVPLDAEIEISGRPTQERFTPPNVAGVIRGSDPALRDTYIVMTAHFDHVGVGNPDAAGDSIYNGADDNASGTAGLLEMAEAFAALPEPPARSVLFLAVSGEEKGLLGAEAWVAEPSVPVDAIVANINMDMIGRTAPDTIVGIGQEYSSLQGVVQEVVTEHPALDLNVILDPNPELRFFFRSDQLPFIKEGIPAVFFTTSEHEDYHKPSDEPAKIDEDKAARVARLAFYIAHEIATDPVAPEWTEAGWAEVQRKLEESPF